MPTTRILHIARYRNRMMERKIEFMSQDTDLLFFCVRPKQYHYKDTYSPMTLQSTRTETYRTLRVPLIGKRTDPHRVLYGSLTFSMLSFRPDIIHAEDEPDSLSALQIILARRALAPTSRIILHTYQNVNRPKSLMVRSVLRATLKGSDAILCANSEGVRILEEYSYQGITDVIPHEGVDTTFFKPLKIQKPLGHFTVMFAGRLVHEKGLDILFHAIKLLDKDVRLLMVGSGPEEFMLRSLAEQLDIKKNVAFLGPQKSSEMPAFINQADVLVLPSRSSSVWKEQYGRILLEAMACKVPVVGSNSGAIPEVIGDAGLIFVEDDVDSLVQCLQDIIEIPNLRKDLANRGYLRAKTVFNQKVIAGRTAQFYRKMVLHKGSSN